MKTNVYAVFLCSLLCLSGSSLAGAQTLNSNGLPKEIPSNLPELDGYVFYDDIPGMQAVIGSGAPRFTPEDTKVQEVFSDEEAALLPPGGRISRSRNGAGLEVWDYPVGTRVLHRFYLNTSPRELFELRIGEKRQDGTWAFGAYEPGTAGRMTLRLAMKRIAFDVRLPRGQVHVDMNRLHPESCRKCHAMRSPQAYQYPDEARTGPCAFGPANPSVAVKWAADYQKAHGYWPFAN